MFRRIRCTGHIINLAVQAFLFWGLIEVEQLKLYDEQEGKGKVEGEAEQRAAFWAIGPLRKLYNIIIHIRNLAGRIREFKDLVGRMIPLDNWIRWNSWY